MSYKDWRGNAIDVGDHVVYPSDANHMVEAEVVEIRIEPHPWKQNKTWPKLKVKRLLESQYHDNVPSICEEQRVVTLQVPFKITKVPY